MRTAYYPLTASPFLRDRSYCEIAPCSALRPYVRCFWGSTGRTETPELLETPEKPEASEPPGTRRSPAPPVQAGPDVVIPDTCMDIIFRLDCGTGRQESCFCGLDKRPYAVRAAAPGSRETFAIRFYGWTAVLFAEDSLAGSGDRTFALEAHFSRLERELGPRLFEAAGLSARARLAEEFLLGALRPERGSSALYNAVDSVLRTGGNVRMDALAQAAVLSPRQLERVFRAGMGCSPKTFASLVRCQCVWQDVVRRPDFRVLDAVAQYGYCDQAHLLHDFKKYHGCSPAQALARARAQRSRFFTIQQGGPGLY